MEFIGNAFSLAVAQYRLETLETEPDDLGLRQTSIDVPVGPVGSIFIREQYLFTNFTQQFKLGLSPRMGGSLLPFGRRLCLSLGGSFGADFNMSGIEYPLYS